MKHLRHWLGGVAIAVAAAAPIIVANPSVQHYIEQHPSVAAYFPVAVGIVRAIYKAVGARNTA